MNFRPENLKRTIKDFSVLQALGHFRTFFLTLRKITVDQSVEGALKKTTLNSAQGIRINPVKPSKFPIK